MYREEEIENIIKEILLLLETKPYLSYKEAIITVKKRHNKEGWDILNYVKYILMAVILLLSISVFIGTFRRFLIAFKSRIKK